MSHNGYKMMKSNVLEDTSVEEIVDSEMEDRLMDKLDKTMEKMQVRRDAGLDVNYSTFSKMKNYAFFHRFSNWFVPFTIDHPDMSQLKKALGDIIELVGAKDGVYVCRASAGIHDSGLGGSDEWFEGTDGCSLIVDKHALCRGDDLSVFVECGQCEDALCHLLYWPWLCHDA